MKIAILTGSVSRKAGGLFNSTRRLAEETSITDGTNLQVFGLCDEFSLSDIQAWNCKTEAFDSLGPSSFGYSPALKEQVSKFSPDIVHQQGVWMYPSLISMSYQRRIISPRGMLDPWALKNSRWKKKLIALFFESKNLNQASCIHALCDSEYASIREYGLKNPVCILPNGIDILERTDLSAPWEMQSSDRKVLLYLGRIHPKKGLLNLLKAWESVSAHNQNWVLAIAGWDQIGHVDQIQKLIEELKMRDSVYILGPQFDDAKAACYENASAFVLPSFSEGLPMTVLEAWAHGLPVIITPQCNLPIGFEKEAAIKIDPDLDSIGQGLLQLFKMDDDELAAMGKRGLELVHDKFTWPKVASQMYDVYQWIHDGGTPPECVRFD